MTGARVLRRLMMLAVAAASAHAAEPERKFAIEAEAAPGFRRIQAPYTPLRVPVFQADDVSDARRLIVGSKLRLSLRDAVALAVANNLDVEVQRFGLLLADADWLRARGGGAVRGLAYGIGEVAPGVGGPASPLLTSPGSRFSVSAAVPANLAELGVLSGQQANLSMLGTLPLSNGSPLPLIEPTLSSVWNWNHQTTPQTSTFTYGTNALVANLLTANHGFQKAFSAGTQVGLVFNNSRQTWNSVRSNYSPFTSSALALNVTQPLLRGFGRKVNQRFLRIAGNEQRISSLLFQQQLVATVYGVVRLYIDLAALNEDLRVKQATLKLAEKLYADTKAQVEEGTLPQVELTRASAQIAAARQDLIGAQGLLEEQEAILKNVITRKGLNSPDVAAARIEVLDALEPPKDDDWPDAAALLGAALARRPDVLQAGLQLENAQIGLEGARNALRPQLDLVGTMQNSGLAGQRNPLASAPDAAFIGGYGSAIEQLLARNYPSYGIGIQLSLPLRNRVAQADAARDEVQARQAQARLAQLRNQVRLEIEAALIAVRRTRAAYQAAVETLKLQEESLAAEQARFEEGISTGFFLMQYQNMVAQARSAEVVARAVNAKARAALLRATGNILEELGISSGAARQP